MLDHNFWRGRRVFITGHTGFKGSWLCLWLEKHGADVTGYSLPPPTEPSLFEQLRLGETTRSIHGDVRDLDRLREAIESSRPEVVLHMAAQSVVRAGYDDPVETYSTNVMGTVNLFEALRQLRHRCVVVNVTSDKCYHNREWVWAYREDEPMGGRDPYSNSKGCAELVTTAYRSSFFPPSDLASHGVAVASARAGNAIGGGDWTSHQLIPDLMRAFIDGKSCNIRSPNSIRPWQFVLEPLRGYLTLAERLHDTGADFAAAWNFGPSEDDAKPVRWLADELVRLWGPGAGWTYDVKAHVPEAHLLKLDISKARTNLNWRPSLPLQVSLEWIVEWYRGYQDQSDLRELTLRQIQRYDLLLRRQLQ